MIRNSAALLLLAWLTPAQVLLNPPRSPSAISVDVDLVNVLCSVRDHHGAYVKDLSQTDFELKVDGRPQPVTHFAREVDSPLTVALLLDVSGSVSEIIGTEKAAAGRFFAEVLRPTDQALLAGFAQYVAVWQDLTPSGPDLQDALGKAQPFERGIDPNAGVRPRGGTLLYDAVNLVAEQKLARLPGRKTMVLITDGEDNGSKVTLDTARKAAQKADTVIYGIHYGRPGMAALQKLSEPTGGRAFDIAPRMPLEAIFAAISEEMRNQYGLGFTPPGGKQDTFHGLEIRVNRTGLKVQARNGYYR
jgi:VWFA-related protein